MTSPLSLRPGAVLAEGVDAGVAAHYGDPFREQRRLTEDVGVVDRSNRGVINFLGNFFGKIAQRILFLSAGYFAAIKVS